MYCFLCRWDGSQLYGSDAATSFRLREGVGGRMKLTPEGLLPLSTRSFGEAGVNDNCAWPCSQGLKGLKGLQGVGGVANFQGLKGLKGSLSQGKPCCSYSEPRSTYMSPACMQLSRPHIFSPEFCANSQMTSSGGSIECSVQW